MKYSGMLIIFLLLASTALFGDDMNTIYDFTVNDIDGNSATGNDDVVTGATFANGVQNRNRFNLPRCRHQVRRLRRAADQRTEQRFLLGCVSKSAEKFADRRGAISRQSILRPAGDRPRRGGG